MMKRLPYLYERQDQPINTSVEFINDFCSKHKIKDYTINSDNSIDVVGNVKFLSNTLGHTGLPIKFNNVYGDFDIRNNIIHNMKGFPKYIMGDFKINTSRLNNFETNPVEKVDGDFYIMMCCKSLKGIPKSVGGDFIIDHDGKFTEEDVEKYCKVNGKIYPNHKSWLFR